MGWREQAACRGLDPDLFLLDKSESGDVPKAKAVLVGQLDMFGNDAA